MTADTTLPPCMPLPRAMLRLPISSTAKVMYARMLDIVFLSGIEYANGILFIHFPIVELAAALARSTMTVKRSLNEFGGRRTDTASASGLRGTQQDIYTHSGEGGQPLMNAKLEALNQEIEKTEKKLRRAQHEEKILEHQIKTLTRKERTHRLCTRAAMLESYLPHPEAITDKQVSLFLALLFRQDNTRQLMEKVFAGNGNFQGEEADRERS